MCVTTQKITATKQLAGPNLFLVGAAKAGTTSLAEYLDQHPQLFVCRPKEPNYFALPPNQSPTCIGPLPDQRLSELLLGHSVTTERDYLQLFASAQQTPVRADASVRYLYDSQAAFRIHAYAPNAKIIAILREPVDRMHSHYHMNVRMGVEPESFERALELEADRVAQQWGWDWHYQRVSCYGRQLQQYFDLFGRDQVLVLFYQDFCEDPQSVVRSVFRFLDVDDQQVVDTASRSNIGQTPRYRWLRRLLWEDNQAKWLAKQIVPVATRRWISEWIEARNRQPVPKLEEATRRRLSKRFDADRRCLENLLERKLPW